MSRKERLADASRGVTVALRRLHLARKRFYADPEDFMGGTDAILEAERILRVVRESLRSLRV